MQQVLIWLSCHALSCLPEWKWTNTLSWNMRSCHLSFQVKAPLMCHGWVQEQLVSCAELNTLAGFQNLGSQRKKMFWKLFGRHCSSYELWSESKWETCNKPTANAASPPCFSLKQQWFGLKMQWSQSRNKRPEMSPPLIPLELCMLWNQDCISICCWISVVSN